MTLDVLDRFSRASRRAIIARCVEMIAQSRDMQHRRRGLPLTCPFTSCAWEANRPRISPHTIHALRDHLLSSHATAMLLYTETSR